jgi:hypothetical protein
LLTLKCFQQRQSSSKKDIPNTKLQLPLLNIPKGRSQVGERNNIRSNKIIKRDRDRQIFRTSKSIWYLKTQIQGLFEKYYECSDDKNRPIYAEKNEPNFQRLDTIHSKSRNEKIEEPNTLPQLATKSFSSPFKRNKRFISRRKDRSNSVSKNQDLLSSKKPNKIRILRKKNTKNRATVKNTNQERFSDIHFKMPSATLKVSNTIIIWSI